MPGIKDQVGHTASKDCDEPIPFTDPDLHPDAQPQISDEPPIPDPEELPGTPRPIEE